MQSGCPGRFHETACGGSSTCSPGPTGSGSSPGGTISATLTGAFSAATNQATITVMFANGVLCSTSTSFMTWRPRSRERAIATSPACGMQAWRWNSCRQGPHPGGANGDTRLRRHRRARWTSFPGGHLLGGLRQGSGVHAALTAEDDAALRMSRSAGAGQDPCPRHGGDDAQGEMDRHER